MAQVIHMKDAHLSSSSLLTEMFIWPHSVWPFLFYPLLLRGKKLFKTLFIFRFQLSLSLP